VILWLRGIEDACMPNLMRQFLSNWGSGGMGYTSDLLEVLLNGPTWDGHISFTPFSSERTLHGRDLEGSLQALLVANDVTFSSLVQLTTVPASSSGGLSPGDVAAIVICSVLFVAGTAVAVGFLVRRFLRVDPSQAEQRRASTEVALAQLGTLSSAVSPSSAMADGQPPDTTTVRKRTPRNSTEEV